MRPTPESAPNRAEDRRIVEAEGRQGRVGGAEQPAQDRRGGGQGQGTGGQRWVA
jgi:hypothetical protein